MDHDGDPADAVAYHIGWLVPRGQISSNATRERRLRSNCY